MLLNVDDEDFAVGEDVAPGLRGHVGDNDEGLFERDGFDFRDEVVRFSVRGSLGAGEEGEGFAPSWRVEAGLRFPR